MKDSFSAFCIAAPHSGSGKTTIAVALIGALAKRGLRVQPFKCGPDYIDTTYHRQAAGVPSINLDTWMMHPEGMRRSFVRNSREPDVAVIEGVMGLFDGASPASLEGSTADCARLLGIPVVLVVDAHGIAGSIAPLVAGFTHFNRHVRICGVIANNVGSRTHRQILADALSAARLPPLIGALPGNPAWSLRERHLGLVPSIERKRNNRWFADLAAAAGEHIDIKQLLTLSRIRRPLAGPAETIPKPSARIGIAMDKAFHFYYPDNLHHLRRAGFELVEFSPLKDRRVPGNIDWLYIGGGFPEVFAAELAANSAIRESIRAFAESGGRIYAECGGLMYLCRSLVNNAGRKFPMCGVLPAGTFMTKKLHSLGYREVRAICDLPFCKANTVFRGHEFHWSDIKFDRPLPPLFRSIVGKHAGPGTGIRFRNVAASYIHLHFESNPRAVRQTGVPR